MLRCWTVLPQDQLRAFIAVVDEGSFSAAGRKLYRVQSAVSRLHAEHLAGIVHEKVNIRE